MKLKSFIGACIACTAIAVMAVSVHAEKYAIGGSDGHVDGTHNSGSVTVPVMVIPDEGKPATVNGYIMSFTYDPTLATPHEDTSNADSPYATMGDSFDQGIIVSGVTDAGNGKQTLIVAWAAANPVTVAANADAAHETMANITFDIKAENATDIPVEVKMAQLANDNSTVKTEENGGIDPNTVVQGDIDLADILLGDVNGDGSVNENDIVPLFRYVAKITTEEAFEAEYPGALSRSNVSNEDNVVNENDVAKLFRYIAKMITTLE